ncbi:MAG: efflux RND transporter periplasmic adaptor subunit [Candidatus Pseudobacter hemicellulosilyticus]|uniref:Efflux RND transporter periplasmic adaptor subunit n=1 Tax=Candidatus Pseudobacter hemicellulosilyticus TaxID=3121375 RepID=A0AAJ5WY53_9BACT|nr:MAG: efflux RND transporter periplasmic adaptor subunit [Pseudobacter sp.]
MRSHIHFLTAGFAMVFLAGCSSAPAPSKPVAPVAQSKPTKETSLNTLTLTADAYRRLGIQVVDVTAGNTSSGRVYSGELMTVPGGTVTITAPVAGTLLGASGSTGLQAGQLVTKGKQIYRLLILPSEKDLLSAREDIAQKEVQYTVVVQKVDRAKKLLEEKAGSLRAVQEAEAELAGIQATLNVARARLELLKGNGAAQLANSLSTLSIDAPVTGRVQRVFSTPSQVIAAAAPIAEIAATNALWVRVPVYAGDIDRVEKGKPATVQLVSDFGGARETFLARQVQGPQTADPLNTSVDQYYELPNTDSRFRPGERVSVNIPFKGNATGMVIPFSAIAYDINGNSWVYRQTDSLSFERQRVEIERVEDQQAVIKRGLKGGEKIVITGTAELFGTEFGGGK